MIALPKDANTALFIDADNISSSKEVELVLKQLQSSYTVLLKKAYGDWFSERLKGWQPMLAEYEIEPIHSLPTPESGKNATDIRLVIDAMDLLHSQRVDCFWIISSDRDFTPLVRRLKQSGKSVIGVGRQNSASILKNAYHHFINLDEIAASKNSDNSQTNQSQTPGKISSSQANQSQASEKGSSSTKKSSTNSSVKQQSKAKPFTKELLEIAQTSYKNVAVNGGWVTVGQLEPQLKKICQQRLKQSFSCKLFGCNSLVKLLNEVGIFEWDSKQAGGTKSKNKKIKLKQA